MVSLSPVGTVSGPLVSCSAYTFTKNVTLTKIFISYSSDGVTTATFIMSNGEFFIFGKNSSPQTQNTDFTFDPSEPFVGFWGSYTVSV